MSVKEALFVAVLAVIVGGVLVAASLAFTPAPVFFGAVVGVAAMAALSVGIGARR